MSERDDFEKWIGASPIVEMGMGARAAMFAAYKAGKEAARESESGGSEPNGTESAYRYAKNGDYGSSMLVSCQLVVEIVEALRGVAPQPDKWIPEGWKLVPEFSHSDMDVAAHDTGIIDRFQAETIWEVMVNAAPTPPEQESE